MLGWGAASSPVPKGPLIADGFRGTFYISFLVAFAPMDYLQEPCELLFCRVSWLKHCLDVFEVLPTFSITGLEISCGLRMFLGSHPCSSAQP